MTRVLLTGAAGFIGGHIRSALEPNHDVVAIDAMLASAHGHSLDSSSVDTSSVESSSDITRVDVRDHAALVELLASVDVVCHQAAVVGAGVDSADAPAYASHNDFGTAVLLAAMAETGCTRLVLASSMVVYGEGKYRNAAGDLVVPGPRTRLADGIFENTDPATGEVLDWALVEEDSELRPRSTYAASKVAQENYALAWSLATGGSVTALRYHNVYGPHMPRNTPYSGVAAMFRSSLEAGKAPQVYEDGHQARDFVHVSDIAAANTAAIDAALPGFTALNVSSGHPITIGEVASTLSDACRGPAPQITGQYRPGDVRHIVASPEKAERTLGFVAAVSPEQGLREFATAPLRDAEGTGAPRV
ncbi:NAD-dependent dehydratase [Rhodococcus sp. 06-156-3C]|uniref:NAD-dependent epimerase/dehydratase family protein n=1 Tax=Nocardiaceae TaxID=85025 RepID=UPI000522F2A4|nr:MULTISPECIES: NAD-dependent epimerase/dehydratase family protein [Rhodococcus]OZD17681.1 NAD-dependent dehydratase [Rhodococcus sp. 06-156-4C]OZD20285.1 NAD-dependent dehydratase [Rhodococcus sp. 06-156-3C]OZD21519.1 NAD-dependent dehydratase [Rhodococcus sp. 06-156-4a]OZD33277.1 NAD-dependent dehydratase [Rhodococcus sp. 06-156-3b]OZD40052.1 NAD-dependent dehydratase [Rhodococcus sp. 06-156-3]